MDTGEINRLSVLALKKWLEKNLPYWGGQKSAAEVLGISTSHLSSILNGSRPMSENLRLRILKKIGVSYDQLISDLTRDNATRSNVIDIDHAAIIQKFKNKELAKNINEKLVMIEKIDPDALIRVMGFLEGLLAGFSMQHKDPQKNTVEAKARHGDGQK